MSEKSLIGHNKPSGEWLDDESREDWMKRILAFEHDPFGMEACHIEYIQFFGDSYRKSDFANLVRRMIYNATGREGA